MSVSSTPTPRVLQILGPDCGLDITCHWAQPPDMKIQAYPLKAGGGNGAQVGGGGTAGRRAQQQSEQTG